MKTLKPINEPGRFSKARAWAIRAAVAGSITFAAAAAPALVSAQERSLPTPSRLPVPRWVSLKFNEVNARSGPGDDYPAVWVYRARGLPVQVVAETREWRKVCDPDGGVAWIHRRTTDGARTVFHRGAQMLPLRSAPKDKAGVRALLATRGIAKLDRCDKGWCLIEAAKQKGWARQNTLWGLAENRVCR